MHKTVGRSEGLPFCNGVIVGQSPLHLRWKSLGQFLSAVWLQEITPELLFALKPAHCTEKAKPFPSITYILHFHAGPEIHIQVLS